LPAFFYIMSLVKHTGNYTTISNTILNNRDLSWKAKGLWAFINSKPEGWDFSVSRIANQSNDGETATKSGLKELKEAGYLVLVRGRGNKGYMAAYEYHLYENPQVSYPQVENPLVDKGGDISNKDISKLESSKKEKLSIEEKEEKRKNKLEEIITNPIFDLNRNSKFPELSDEDIQLTLQTALVDDPVLRFASAINWLSNESRSRKKALKMNATASNNKKTYNKPKYVDRLNPMCYNSRDLFMEACEKSREAGNIVEPENVTSACLDKWGEGRTSQGFNQLKEKIVGGMLEMKQDFDYDRARANILKQYGSNTSY